MITAGIAGFFVSRSLNDASADRAQESIAARGAFWYVPLIEEEKTRPRTEQLISGIRVGPAVERIGSGCPGERELVSIDSTSGTEFDPRPAYLPEGTVLSQSDAFLAVACGGQFVSVEAHYVVRGDREKGVFGGALTVLRFRGGPSFRLAAASDRMTGGTVDGRPAIIIRPLTEDGFGDSAVLMREAYGLTVIRADGIRLEELLKVAESLSRGASDE